MWFEVIMRSIKLSHLSKMEMAIIWISDGPLLLLLNFHLLTSLICWFHLMQFEQLRSASDVAVLITIYNSIYIYAV